jgi:hypothetical protein
MTKESIISLIAAAVLVGMGTFSIFSAADGRTAFDNEPGATATQMYASNAGTNDLQEAMFGGKIVPPVYQIGR